MFIGTPGTTKEIHSATEPENKVPHMFYLLSGSQDLVFMWFRDRLAALKNSDWWSPSP